MKFIRTDDNRIINLDTVTEISTISPDEYRDRIPYGIWATTQNGEEVLIAFFTSEHETTVAYEKLIGRLHVIEL